MSEQKTAELAMTVVDRASAIEVIRDDQGYSAAGEVLVAVKNGIKEVKKYWEDPVKKARAALDALTERRKAMLEPLEFYERDIKARMLAYKEQAEAERRAKERVAREALEAQAKAEREALVKEKEAFGDVQGAEAVALAPVVVPPVLLPGAPKVDGVKFREDWKFEVVDASLIPREYLAIDEAKLAKIARAMKADAKVPGVRFYPEKIIMAGR